MNSFIGTTKMSDNLTSMSPRNVEATQAPRGSPIISDEIMNGPFMYSNLLIRGPFALFGTINNIINMIIFYRLGLKDSMSVGLWALSLSDFSVTFFGFAGTSFFVWYSFFPDTVMDPTSFGAVSWGWWHDIFQLISAWISTFLAMERCVCVVFPFKVKQIFTKARSIGIMVVIYVVNIAIHIPVFATQWLGWTKIKVKSGNTTVLKDRIVLKYSSNRDQIQLYIDIANGAILPFPSQFLVLVSVVWMIYGLRVSSRIRTTTMGGNKSDTDPKKDFNLSDKERRLVKVVLFLAIILTVCNIPRFLAVYAKQIFEEVSIGRDYQNLYNFLWNLAVFAGVTNASVNIFVYMAINKNYQAAFKKLFGCWKEDISQT